MKTYLKRFAISLLLIIGVLVFLSATAAPMHAQPAYCPDGQPIPLEGCPYPYSWCQGCYGAAHGWCVNAGFQEGSFGYYSCMGYYVTMYCTQCLTLPYTVSARTPKEEIESPPDYFRFPSITEPPGVVVLWRRQ